MGRVDDFGCNNLVTGLRCVFKKGRPAFNKKGALFVLSQNLLTSVG